MLIEGNSPYLANAIAHVSCPNTLPIGPATAVWQRFETASIHPVFGIE